MYVHLGLLTWYFENELKAKRTIRFEKGMSQKPKSSPWSQRPVRKSGKKKVTTEALKKGTGVRVISNARPKKRRYFSPQSYLTLGLIIACMLFGLSYMDKFGLGYKDPATRADKRAVEVLRGPITHVRDGDTFEVNRLPIRIAVLDCAGNSTSEGKKITRFA